MKNAQDECQQQTQQNHRGDGNINAGIRTVDDDITGQMPQGNFTEPGPENSDQGDDDSDYNNYAAQGV